MPTIDSLDDEIRSLYVELIDAVPPPPGLEDLWQMASNGQPVRRPTTSRRRLYRWVMLGGTVGIAMALVICLAVFLPSNGSQSADAAAVELRQIAAQAERQAPITLGPGQWLITEQRESTLISILHTHRIEIQPNQYGSISDPTTNAQAVVIATIREWTNTTGTECVSEASGPATFASSVNKAAWMASGFLARPNRALLAGPNCMYDDLLLGPSVINVAGLSTDPQVLARDLEDGTLGIPSLDQVGGKSGALDRATTILLGPTIGATPAFNAALLRAVALVPGIQALGQLTTQQGKVGLGFTAPGILGPLTIILDPSTGVLLEGRNVDISQFYASTVLMNAYKAHTNGTFAARTIVKWLDPIGSPSAVDHPPAG